MFCVGHLQITTFLLRGKGITLSITKCFYANEKQLFRQILDKIREKQLNVGNFEYKNRVGTIGNLLEQNH